MARIPAPGELLSGSSGIVGPGGPAGPASYCFKAVYSFSPEPGPAVLWPGPAGASSRSFEQPRSDGIFCEFLL